MTIIKSKVAGMSILIITILLLSACNFPSAVVPQQTTPTGLIVGVSAPSEYRAGPGEGFALLGTLNPGQTVEAVGRNLDGSYLVIRDPISKSILGWMKSEFAIVTANLSGLPIITAPIAATSISTPTPAGGCPTPIAGGPTAVDCSFPGGSPSGTGCPTPIGGGPTAIDCSIPGSGPSSGGCPTPIGGGPTAVDCSIPGSGPSSGGCPTPIGGGPTPVDCSSPGGGPSTGSSCPTPIGGGPTSVDCSGPGDSPSTGSGCPTPIGGGPTPFSCSGGSSSGSGCPTPFGGGPTPVSCTGGGVFLPPGRGPTATATPPKR